jgi:hypothetical protein
LGDEARLVRNKSSASTLLDSWLESAAAAVLEELGSAITDVFLLAFYISIGTSAAPTVGVLEVGLWCGLVAGSL